MQAIFSERKDDLNLALDEMKDKVTSLMHSHGHGGHGGHGHGHGGHVAPHGRSAGNVKASVAASEFTEAGAQGLEDHWWLCTVWRKLGISLKLWSKDA